MAPGAGATDGGRKYAIYSTKSNKPSELEVQENSNVDKFLGFLKAQGIVLEKKPNPSAKVDEADDLSKWFKRFGTKAEITVNVDFIQERTMISSLQFDFIMPWKGSPAVCFSSSPAAINFSFGAPVPEVDGQAARVMSPGIEEKGEMLCCGLDPKRTATDIYLTVRDVFKYVGQDRRALSLPGAVGEMTLTLDPTKTAGQRNALWFNSSFHSQTTLRLQFRVKAATALKEILEPKLPGFTLETVDVVCKKILIAAQTEIGPAAVDQGEATLYVQCKIKPKDHPDILFSASIEFLPGSVRMTLQASAESDALGGLLAWLVERIDDDVTFVQDLTGKDGIFSHVKLRQVSLTLDTGASSRPAISSFGLDIEVAANFGRVSGGKPALFLISYNWVRGRSKMGTIQGQLWTWFKNDPTRDLTPFYEPWSDLQPTTHDPARALELCALIPGQTVYNMPDFIRDSQLTRASITLSQDTFTVGGTIATTQPQGQLPHPYFGQMQLDASYSWGKQKEFSFVFGVKATLAASPSAKRPTPTDLWGQLKYNSKGKTWALTAALNGLSGSALYELFDASSASHVMPLIDSLAVRRLLLRYEYTKANAPAATTTRGGGEEARASRSSGSSFSVSGTILVAGLRLKLDYKHEKTTWKFEANMDPHNTHTSIGEIAASILGDDNLELPDFLANTAFTPSDSIHLKLDKAGTDKEKKSMQFLASLQVGKVALTFLQYHGTGSGWGPKTPSKRLVKVAIQGLPDLQIPEIPLLGKIEQPVQEISYLWIQDPVPKTGTLQPGLTRKEVKDLNATLQADNNALVYKDKFPIQREDDLIFPAGSHFIILSSSAAGAKSCLLDYAFQAGRRRSPNPSAAPPAVSSRSSTAEASTSEAGNETTEQEKSDGTSAHASLKKKTGPLTLKNVGLKYTDKKLHILLDATFHLGPLEFSLLGFSIGLEIKSLSQVPTVSQPELQGLTAAFEKPPLTIAGAIRHGIRGALDYYAGGLVVGFNPWQFEAAGFFGVASPENGAPFKSLFLFARLNGPLFELEFAEISGLTGGFGYNSDVRTPAPDQVVDFPFVATQKLGDSGDDIVTTLERLTDPGSGGWFYPYNEMYWAAAGLKVDALQMLSVDAVLVVQFGASVKIGVFAVAVADIPASKIKGGAKFAHVELGLAATLDIDYGTFKVEAQLSPNSFILHPDCHLTGGVRFVLTLGGYHPAFKIPDGYPRPPRLGISWSLGRSLSISGEAYFAITPKACMAGGRLHASFSAGPIEAWFDAFADFLINYKPFHFLASAGISVGVRFNIDVWFVHTHISVEIGADITLWGPPVAGRVHVDFWILAFDVNFGDGPPVPEPVHLLAFYELVLQASSQQGSASVEALADSGSSAMNRAKNESHLFLVRSGLLNTSGPRTTGDGKVKENKDPWCVRAGSFSFVISCKMAVSSVTQGGSKCEHQPAIYAKPMQLTSSEPLTSTMSVKITQEGVKDDGPAWRMEKQLKSVPTALWGPYSTATDPAKGGNNISQLLDHKDGGVPLMMGVLFNVPPPQLSPDKLPPYDVSKAALVPLTAKNNFPTSTTAQTDWEPTPHPPKPDDGEQWETLHKTWKNPPLGTGSNGQSGFVSKWAEAFHWDTSISQLAALPKRMDARFNSLFVAAPLLGR